MTFLKVHFHWGPTKRMCRFKTLTHVSDKDRQTVFISLTVISLVGCFLLFLIRKPDPGPAPSEASQALLQSEQSDSMESSTRWVLTVFPWAWVCLEFLNSIRIERNAPPYNVLEGKNMSLFCVFYPEISGSYYCSFESATVKKKKPQLLLSSAHTGMNSSSPPPSKGLIFCASWLYFILVEERVISLQTDIFFHWGSPAADRWPLTVIFSSFFFSKLLWYRYHGSQFQVRWKLRERYCGTIEFLRPKGQHHNVSCLCSSPRKALCSQAVDAFGKLTKLRLKK